MAKGKSKLGGGGGQKAVVPITNAKSFGDRTMDSSTLKEVDDFFGTSGWMGATTVDEQGAVTWYTGSAYVDLNKRLRKGDDLTLMQQDKVQLLDKALAKGELKEPVTLYRGSSASFLGGRSTVGEIQELVGSTITDKGYTSTSISKHATFGGGIGYKIIVPAGKGHGAFVRGISQVKGENEFLLKRNTSFRVMGVAAGSGGTPIVTLQVVG